MASIQACFVTVNYKKPNYFPSLFLQDNASQVNEFIHLMSNFK